MSTRSKKYVDQNMLNDIIHMMSKQNMEALTVDELLGHLTSMQIDEESEVLLGASETPFKFKTPMRVAPQPSLSEAFQNNCSINGTSAPADTSSTADNSGPFGPIGKVYLDVDPKASKQGNSMKSRDRVPRRRNAKDSAGVRISTAGVAGSFATPAAGARAPSTFSPPSAMMVDSPGYSAISPSLAQAASVPSVPTATARHSASGISSNEINKGASSGPQVQKENNEPNFADNTASNNSPPTTSASVAVDSNTARFADLNLGTGFQVKFGVGKDAKKRGTRGGKLMRGSAVGSRFTGVRSSNNSANSSPRDNSSVPISTTSFPSAFATAPVSAPQPAPVHSASAPSSSASCTQPSSASDAMHVSDTPMVEKAAFVGAAKATPTNLFAFSSTNSSPASINAIPTSASGYVSGNSSTQTSPQIFSFAQPTKAGSDRPSFEFKQATFPSFGEANVSPQYSFAPPPATASSTASRTSAQVPFSLHNPSVGDTFSSGGASTPKDTNSSNNNQRASNVPSSPSKRASGGFMSPGMSAGPVRSTPSRGRTSLGTGARRRVTVSHSKVPRPAATESSTGASADTGMSEKGAFTASSKSSGTQMGVGEAEAARENISDKLGSASGASAGSSSSPRPSTARNQQAVQQAEAAWQSGKSLYSRGDYLQAMEAFTQALDFLGADMGVRQRPTILGNRAAAFFMLERYVEAVDDCERALKLDNTLSKLYLRMGRARLRLGMLPRAEDDFRGCLQACQLQQRNGGVVDTTVPKEAQDCLSSVLQARDAQNEMFRYESVGSYEAALRQAERLLQICPHSLEACVLKGKALCQLRRYDAAKTYLESIMSRTHASLLKLHAHPLASFPPPDPASLAFTTGTPASSTQASLCFNSAECAEAIFCLGSDLGRVYLSCVKNTKLCHLNCGDVIDSVHSVLIILERRMKAAIKSGPFWLWVETECSRVSKLLDMKKLADRAFRESNFEKAINFYSEAIKVDPEAIRWQAILQSNRAASNMRLSKFAAAVGDCHQALGLDPENARAHLRRARAYVALKDYDSAIRDFRRYLSWTPAQADRSDVEQEFSKVLADQRIEQHEEQRRAREQQQRQNSWSRGPWQDDDEFEEEGYEDYSDNYHRSDRRPSQGFHQNSTRGTARKAHGSAAPKQWSQYGKQQGDGSPGRRPFTSQPPPRRPPPPPPAPPTPKEKDHYTILGISITATDREIKTAYRKMALKFHPDKNKDAGAEDIFKSVTEAYMTLSDATTRRRYDLSRPL